MAFIYADERIMFKSFGVTLLIVLSALPSISQDAITSHKAIPHVSRNAFFSSVAVGVYLSSKAESTRQNLFCGCP